MARAQKHFGETAQSGKWGTSGPPSSDEHHTVAGAPSLGSLDPSLRASLASTFSELLSNRQSVRSIVGVVASLEPATWHRATAYYLFAAGQDDGEGHRSSPVGLFFVRLFLLISSWLIVAAQAVAYCAISVYAASPPCLYSTDCPGGSSCVPVATSSPLVLEATASAGISRRCFYDGFVIYDPREGINAWIVGSAKTQNATRALLTIASMTWLDWFVLILAGVVIALAIASELRDIVYCLASCRSTRWGRPNAESDHRLSDAAVTPHTSEDSANHGVRGARGGITRKPSRRGALARWWAGLPSGWAAPFWLLCVVRQWLVPPLLLAAVRALIVHRGADAVSICLNAVAILFLLDIDQMAYTYGLGEGAKKRVETSGRDSAQLSRADVTMVDASKLLYSVGVPGAIVLSLFFSRCQPDKDDDFFAEVTCYDDARAGDRELDAVWGAILPVFMAVAFMQAFLADPLAAKAAGLVKVGVSSVGGVLGADSRRQDKSKNRQDHPSKTRQDGGSTEPRRFKAVPTVDVPRWEGAPSGPVAEAQTGEPQLDERMVRRTRSLARRARLRAATGSTAARIKAFLSVLVTAALGLGAYVVFAVFVQGEALYAEPRQPCPTTDQIAKFDVYYGSYDAEANAAKTEEERYQIEQKYVNNYNPAKHGRQAVCQDRPPSSLGSCYPVFREEPDNFFCDCEPGKTGRFCQIDLCEEPSAPRCPSGQVCVGSVDEGFRPDCILGQQYGFEPLEDDVATCQAQRSGLVSDCYGERGPGDYVGLNERGCRSKAVCVPEAEACVAPRLKDERPTDRKVRCNDTLVAWRYGNLKDKDGRTESFDEDSFFENREDKLASSTTELAPADGVPPPPPAPAPPSPPPPDDGGDCDLNTCDKCWCAGGRVCVGPAVEDCVLPGAYGTSGGYYGTSGGYSSSGYSPPYTCSSTWCNGYLYCLNNYCTVKEYPGGGGTPPPSGFDCSECIAPDFCDATGSFCEKGTDYGPDPYYSSGGYTSGGYRRRAADGEGAEGGAQETTAGVARRRQGKEGPAGGAAEGPGRGAAPGGAGKSAGKGAGKGLRRRLGGTAGAGADAGEAADAGRGAAAAAAAALPADPRKPAPRRSLADALAEGAISPGEGRSGRKVVPLTGGL